MITVLGEALMHLSPAPDGTTLHAEPGGSALNIAVAAARLGHPAALMARLSRDSYGEVLRAYAKSNGVDVSGAPEAEGPTAIEIGPARAAPGTRPQLYGSYASADHWSAEDLAWLPPETTVLHVGSLVWSDAPSAAVAARAATRLRKRGGITWLDLQIYREAVKTPGQCRILLERSARLADVVVASVSDVGWLYPGRSPHAVAEQWLALGVAQVFMASASGTMVIHGPGSVLYRSPPGPAPVVDVTGAIDAFTAALLGCVHDCLERGRDVRNPPAASLARALDLATVAAAMTCERAGADPPTAAELRGRLTAIHGTLTPPPEIFCFINTARLTFLVAHAKEKGGASAQCSHPSPNPKKGLPLSRHRRRGAGRRRVRDHGRPRRRGGQGRRGNQRHGLPGQRAR